MKIQKTFRGFGSALDPLKGAHSWPPPPPPPPPKAPADYSDRCAIVFSK